MTKSRIKWLDVARSIAIIAITTNHAVNHSFDMHEGMYAEFVSLPIAITIIKTLLNAFSRIGVPLFLMISGALMIPKDYEQKGALSHFLKHNWLQLLITTEIWLAIMFWIKQFMHSSVLHTSGLAKCLIRFMLNGLFINTVTFENMWYMPMILCVYLLIPVLSIFLKRVNNRFIIIPVCIVIISSMLLVDANAVLSNLGFATELKWKLESANVFSVYIVYILAGYFIGHKLILQRIRTWIIVIGLIISFVAFCLFQFWSFSTGKNIIVGYMYRSSFTLVSASFLFELLRRANISDMLGNISTRLARISFGIYFVHICIVYMILALIKKLDWSISQLPLCLLIEFVSFFGSILIISILKKSKFLAKNLFVIK